MEKTDIRKLSPEKQAVIRGRGYAPAGKTTVVKSSGKREHISMVSTIRNRGKVF
jgi:hypothetical protein